MSPPNFAESEETVPRMRWRGGWPENSRLSTPLPPRLPNAFLALPSESDVEVFALFPLRMLILSKRILWLHKVRHVHIPKAL